MCFPEESSRRNSAHLQKTLMAIKHVYLGRLLLRYVEIPTHSHEFVECAFVLRGNCIHRIDESEVMQHEGSFILVPVPVPHQLIALDDAACLTIKIRLSSFMKMSMARSC